MVKHDENPADALQRHEFVEVIVRLAQDKFKEPKLCSTMAEAVTKILEEHIIMHGDIPNEWQEWRDEQLWTLEVNDVFEANLDLMKKLYAGFLAPM